MKDTGSVDLKVGSRGRKPSLSSEDIENIRRTVLYRAGVMLIYLPAYSPDWNPIEMMWSKVKAKKRTEESLVAAIKEAMKEITPEDCQGWFREAGCR